MDKDIIEKLDSFFSAFPARVFKRGDLLIQAGTQPLGIFYIEEGIIRRYYLSAEGTEITLNLYKPHTFLPMSWAVGNIENEHFYEALTKVKTRKAPKEEVIAFIKREPDVLYDLLRRIYIGMEGLWMHLQSLTAGNSSVKLIASLVILAKRFGKKELDNMVIQLKMSEKDLANYAGVSRETASRELQKLKKDQLVSFTKGIITVHKLHVLEDSLLH